MSHRRAASADKPVAYNFVISFAIITQKAEYFPKKSTIMITLVYFSRTGLFAQPDIYRKSNKQKCH